MAAPVKMENIVEVYKIGNTTIKISDAAYVNRTPAEISKTLEMMTAVGWKIVKAARAAGKDI
jgi:hypothetical protein